MCAGVVLTTHHQVAGQLKFLPAVRERVEACKKLVRELDDSVKERLTDVLQVCWDGRGAVCLPGCVCGRVCAACNITQGRRALQLGHEHVHSMCDCVWG